MISPCSPIQRVVTYCGLVPSLPPVACAAACPSLDVPERGTLAQGTQGEGRQKGRTATATLPQLLLLPQITTTPVTCYEVNPSFVRFLYFPVLVSGQMTRVTAVTKHLCSPATGAQIPLFPCSVIAFIPSTAETSGLVVCRHSQEDRRKPVCVPLRCGARQRSQPGSATAAGCRVVPCQPLVVGHG